ncbi:MAG TPA: O-antigen ligase family protein [Patescibacteria group bacterium]|nr:O-antigen ligase family protein [Patescibacteria group bacterium]
MFCGIALWFARKGLPLKDIAPVGWPLAAVFSALCVSFIASADKPLALQELHTNHYVSGMLLFIFAAGLSRAQQSRVISCMLAGALAVSILAIHQYFFGFRRLFDFLMAQGIVDQPSLGYIIQRRVFFPFVTPNTLAGYLAMMIPLALTEKKRFWLIIPLSVAFMMTKSVTALLSMALALLVYLFLKPRMDKKKIICVVALLLAAGAIMFFARTQTTKKHLQPAFSTVVRWHYWKDTLPIIQKSPVTGVGLGNFDLEKWSHYAHNSYLQVWAETGVIGIAAFLYLIALVLRVSLRALKDASDASYGAALIAAHTAFLIHNLIDFTFFLPEVCIFWWLIMGLSISGRKDVQAGAP